MSKNFVTATTTTTTSTTSTTTSTTTTTTINNATNKIITKTLPSTTVRPPDNCRTVTSKAAVLVVNTTTMSSTSTSTSAATATASSSNDNPRQTNNQATAVVVGQAVNAKLIDMGKRLLDATREGRIEHVRQLVFDSGAPFTSDWLGTTALHLASQNGHAGIAEILLRGGVNRDAKTKLERTALHLAAQGGYLDVVDLLLIHGCDVNARDMLKMTPLHWAVERGHIFVVERLLYSGADINAKSKFHLTPIDIAHNSKSYKMIEIFKSWINKHDILDPHSSNLNNLVFNDSSSMLEVDYHLAFNEDKPATTSQASVLDIDEPCIDLVELEWNSLKFEPDFFLANDEGEPKVEYLMKIVDELQRENRQLKKKVEQLSTTCQ